VFTYVINNPAAVCEMSPSGAVVPNLPPPSANYECEGGKLQSGSMWLGVAGLMLTGILMSRSFKGSIIIGAPPGTCS
jgi:xanthine/uracil/vitamin C permease (AzgA family)